MVKREEYELLLKRFRHLLESDTIALYDEVDPKTKEYKRDIKELDIACKRIEGCTPLTIYMPDIFIEQGQTEQLKEFIGGVIEDAIYKRQKELNMQANRYPRSK